MHWFWVCFLVIYVGGLVGFIFFLERQKRHLNKDMDYLRELQSHVRDTWESNLLPPRGRHPTGRRSPAPAIRPPAKVRFAAPTKRPEPNILSVDDVTKIRDLLERYLDGWELNHETLDKNKTFEELLRIVYGEEVFEWLADKSKEML